MDVKIIHFYPDLMSLYGSWANVALLRRHLEDLGNTVTVEAVLPGQTADLTDADFLYLGAGTERAQKAALADLVPVLAPPCFLGFLVRALLLLSDALSCPEFDALTTSFLPSSSVPSSCSIAF